MQFTKENATKVMAGTKVQTRRLVTAGDRHIREADGAITHVTIVTEAGRRLKWKVGLSYAVQPGRGKPAIGRVKLLEIRKQRLQDISEEDCFAEGIEPVECLDCDALILIHLADETHYEDPTPAFRELWNSINPKGQRWADNPDVWALTFEVVK